jgi:hypothetical protein
MRILFAFVTCDAPKYAERRRLVESTWLKRLPAGYDVRICTGDKLGTGDTYNDLCAKTKAICQDADVAGYDWLIKCDDDVFCRPENLVLPESDYAGYLLNEGFDSRGKLNRYCSGGFYWLRRNAFRLVADAEFDPKNPSGEDRWVAQVLRREGILPAWHRVAFQQCPCGKPGCPPMRQPQDWAAFIIGMRWKPETFLDLEQQFRKA